MDKKLFLKIYGVIILFVYIFYSILSKNDYSNVDFYCIVTFMFNGIIWFFLFISEIKKYSYSLKMMHYFFCLFFYFLAAIVQYSQQHFPWVGFRSNDIVFKTNVCLMIWTFAFEMGSSIKIELFPNIKKYLLTEFVCSFKKINILQMINILILLYKIMSVGFSGLFINRTDSELSYGTDSSINLLLDHITTAWSCFVAIYAAILIKKEKKYFFNYLISIICLILSSFPTVISRYAVAAIYGSLLIIVFDKLRVNRAFIVIFAIGFLIIFPFLENFRRSNVSDIDLIKSINYVISNISTSWTQGHYDAYTTCSLAIEYSDDYGLTYGYQLLGVFLFFIPRSIWINKPIGSGAMMAEELGTFTNISCSIPGEGYINFGICGLIFFGVILGCFTKKIDCIYWSIKSQTTKISALYPVVMLLFFFMCRGDLLSSFAYLVSYVVVWFIISYSKEKNS